MDPEFLLTAFLLLNLACSACVDLDIVHGNTFIDAGDVRVCCNNTHLSFDVQLTGSYTFKPGATQTIKIDILDASTTTYDTIPGQFEYKYDATGTSYQIELLKPDAAS